jgi:hypothetical protein
VADDENGGEPDHRRMNRLTNRIAPICLVAGMVLLAASLALKPIHSAGARQQLDQVAAHTGAFEASTLLQIVAATLLVPGLITLARTAAGKLGGVAVGLLYVNTLGDVGDAGHSATLLAAAKNGVSSADVELVKSIDTTSIASLVELMVLVGLLGFPLLAVALYKSRVARWIPIAIGVAFVSFFAPISEGFGAAVLAIALSAVAFPGRFRAQPVPSSAAA